MFILTLTAVLFLPFILFSQAAAILSLVLHSVVLSHYSHGFVVVLLFTNSSLSIAVLSAWGKI